MIHVELDIFSGRPNPIWTLTKSEQQQFIEFLTANQSIILPMTTVESKLGYRGFVVSARDESEAIFLRYGLPTNLRIGASEGSSTTDAALWLLQSSEKHKTAVVDEVYQVTHTSILQSQTDSEPMIEPESTDVPEENPESTDGPGMSCASNYFTSSSNFSFWNSDPYVRANNNCYNFASNYRTNTFAQPGRISGHQFTPPPNCSNVASSVRYDGYADGCLASQNITIYLVIWPNTDFHFYRLCSGGKWCHKPGSTNATNRDNSNNYIYNPETCNRGYYTTGCEYFYSGNGSRPVN